MPLTWRRCPVAVDAQTFAGSLLTLQGAGAYDAAVHCASVSAARRLLQQQHYGVAETSLQPRSPLGFRWVSPPLHLLSNLGRIRRALQ